MLLFNNTSTNPYFNIALEEFLLKEIAEDCFMIWQNRPSVILGKHQNALAEADILYCEENNIPVVRRISGGGTVFHDTGNVNFTFIKNGEEGKLVDFKSFTEPIIKALSKLGIEAHFGGNNDIRIGEYKISGNAEHVYKTRVLHHGTLLFNSELDQLKKSIRPGKAVYTDKSVKSVRARVGNISSFLSKQHPIEYFKKLLTSELTLNFTNVKLAEIDEPIERKVNKLVTEKYQTWEWNIGYFPKYKFNNSFTGEGIDFSVELFVQKGIITEAKLHSNTLKKDDLEQFRLILLNKRHAVDELNKLIYSEASFFLPNPNLRQKLLSCFF